MRHIFIFIIFFLNILVVNAQSVEQLAERITANAQTDDEKVMAIFEWLRDSISYDYERYKMNFISHKEHLDNVRIEDALRSKMGVCHDYALLFNKLCEVSKIESIVVSGHGSTLHLDNGHSWNIIKTNQEWNIYDATFASSHKNDNENSFQFYKIPPQEAIKTHYPDIYTFQLLKKPIYIKNFLSKTIDTNLVKQDFINDSIQKFQNLNLFQKQVFEYQSIKTMGDSTAYRKTYNDYLCKSIAIEYYNTAINSYNLTAQLFNKRALGSLKDEDLSKLVRDMDENMDFAFQYELQLQDLNRKNSEEANTEWLSFQKEVKKRRKLIEKYLSKGEIGRIYFYSIFSLF